MRGSLVGGMAVTPRPGARAGRMFSRCWRHGVAMCLWFLGTAGMGLVVSAAPAGATPARPETPTCTTTWLHAVNGAWSDGSDWSNGEPGSSSVACITVPGNYTVTAVNESNGPTTGVLVLGSTGHDQSETLEITNACIQAVPNTTFTIAGSGTSDVTSDGKITITSATNPNGVPSGCYAYTHLDLAPKATLDNGGAIEVQQNQYGQSNDNQIDLVGGRIVNTGMVSIDTPLSDGSGGTWDNAGAVRISNGDYLQATNLAFVNEAGGSVVSSGKTSSGYLELNSDQGTAAWTDDGGATAGAPPVLNTGTLTYEGNGASSVAAEGTVSLRGTIPKRDSLLLGNNDTYVPSCTCNTTTVLAGRTVTNEGSIVMKAPGYGYTNLDIAVGKSFVNDGSFQTGGIASSWGIEDCGVFRNDGSVSFDAATMDDGCSGGTWDNAGAVRIANGDYLQATNLAFVNEVRGSVTSTGSSSSGYLELLSDAGTAHWTDDGGRTSGAPVIVDGGVLSYKGNGASTVAAENNVSLGGTIPKKDTLILGNYDKYASDCTCNTTTVLAGRTVTNEGSIVMTAPGYGYSDLDIATHQTLVNAGSLETRGVASSWSLDIAGTLDNAGTVTVDVPTAAGGVGTWRNTGRLVLGSGGNLNLGSGGTTSFVAGTKSSIIFVLRSRSVYGYLTGGLVRLAGTAEPLVKAGYHPAAGASFEVVQSPHSGKFDKVSGTFSARYSNASEVSLVYR